MRKFGRAALVGAVTAMTIASLVTPTLAANRSRDVKGATPAHRTDNRPGPLSDRQEARRKAAQELILSGQASPGEDGVIALDEGKYFEAAVEGPATVFTILSEFGTQAKGKYGTVPGPAHDQIPKPNRELVDGQPNTVDAERAVQQQHGVDGQLRCGLLRRPVLRARTLLPGLLHAAVVRRLPAEWRRRQPQRRR